MGEILALTSVSLRRIVVRARFFIALVLSFCVVFFCCHGVPAFLQEQGMTVQAVELFPLLMSGHSTQLLLTLCFLLLVGDAPFFHEGMETVLVRTKKSRWLAAQILTMGILVLAWLLFLQLCLLLMTAGRVTWDNQWSVYIKTAARLWRSSLATGLSGGMTTCMAVIQSATPYSLFFTALLYGFLLFFSFGMWGLMLNLWTRRSYGSAIVTAFFALRFALFNLLYIKPLLWLSPSNLVDITGRSINPPPSPVYVILFFLLQILLLGIFSLRNLRQRDMTRLR